MFRLYFFGQSAEYHTYSSYGGHTLDSKSTIEVLYSLYYDPIIDPIYHTYSSLAGQCRFEEHNRSIVFIVFFVFGFQVLFFLIFVILFSFKILEKLELPNLAQAIPCEP